MKGIYLTEQGKKQLEAKITALQKIKNDTEATLEWNEAVFMINVYKEILSSATILPIEEIWDDINHVFDYDLIKAEKLKENVPIQVDVKSSLLTPELLNFYNESMNKSINAMKKKKGSIL
jgi:hypothetical protein